ncbi:antitoxin Xre/MbcA/ParS toxin-binding domain-containing protein [Thalassospira lucentensis]|uniref:type II RES/Xre toxin-antitoxin system antitoxin n=1 Tax=Thalassospira lucentensis TaxID=168935 RepID=UPI00399D636B
MSSAVADIKATNDSGPAFWKAVGIPARGPALHEALQQGIPYATYGKLASAAGLDRKELAKYVVIPMATLQRRAKLGRFKVDESDKLYRFAEVLNAATNLFEGDRDRARQWLLSPVQGLGGACPAEMIATSAGTDAVLDLIGRLEHGVFA